MTSSSALRLMCVHAHPDDESSKGAATMARYVDEGHQVLVVTCTGGERGSILNPALQNRPEIEANIASIRRDEMARAVAILGVQHHWLGFVDSGLPEGDPLPPLPGGSFAAVPVEECVRRLVEVVRRFRPHVMTTYDENGGYPHPDHIRTHDASVGAFEAAGDPSYAPELGEPWQPLKLYYDVGFSVERFDALDSALRERGMDSPFDQWRAHQAERAERAAELGLRHPRVTTRIAVADWFDRRDEALLAHETQVDPGGWFFGVPQEIQRVAWPWEQFELARSLVDSTEPEDDLFAGIRERVSS